MKSSTYQPSYDFSNSLCKTRKAIFLDQMDCVVPWARLVDLNPPHYPEGRKGQPQFALEPSLCNHFLRQWLNFTWHVVMRRDKRKVLKHAGQIGEKGAAR